MTNFYDPAERLNEIRRDQFRDGVFKQTNINYTTVDDQNRMVYW